MRNCFCMPIEATYNATWYLHVVELIQSFHTSIGRASSYKYSPRTVIPTVLHPTNLFMFAWGDHGDASHPNHGRFRRPRRPRRLPPAGRRCPCMHTASPDPPAAGGRDGRRREAGRHGTTTGEGIMTTTITMVISAHFRRPRWPKRLPSAVRL